MTSGSNRKKAWQSRSARGPEDLGAELRRNAATREHATPLDHPQADPLHRAQVWRGTHDPVDQAARLAIRKGTSPDSVTQPRSERGMGRRKTRQNHRLCARAHAGQASRQHDGHGGARPTAVQPQMHYTTPPIPLPTRAKKPKRSCCKPCASGRHACCAPKLPASAQHAYTLRDVITMQNIHRRALCVIRQGGWKAARASVVCRGQCMGSWIRCNSRPRRSQRRWRHWKQGCRVKTWAGCFAHLRWSRGASRSAQFSPTTRLVCV